MGLALGAVIEIIGEPDSPIITKHPLGCPGWWGWGRWGQGEDQDEAVGRSSEGVLAWNLAARTLPQTLSETFRLNICSVNSLSLRGWTDGDLEVVQEIWGDRIRGKEKELRPEARRLETGKKTFVSPFDIQSLPGQNWVPAVTSLREPWNSNCFCFLKRCGRKWYVSLSPVLQAVRSEGTIMLKNGAQWRTTFLDPKILCLYRWLPYKMWLRAVEEGGFLTEGPSGELSN